MCSAASASPGGAGDLAPSWVRLGGKRSCGGARQRPLWRSKLPASHETIDYSQVADSIERVHARHMRTPIGSYSGHLEFFIRLRVQLQDAIDRHSIAVVPGAVLRRSIRLTVLLENTPRWAGRANIALDRVAAMGRPG